MSDKERDELIAKAREWVKAFHGTKSSERLNSVYYITALADALEKTSHVWPARELLAQGWDAAVAAIAYEDGTPVEIAASLNPYRIEPAQ